MGEEKRAWYTLFAHAQFPRDFRKICSVTLTSPIKKPVTEHALCRRDEGPTEVLSSLLTGNVHAFVRD